MHDGILRTRYVDTNYMKIKIIIVACFPVDKNILELQDRRKFCVCACGGGLHKSVKNLIYID